MVKKAINKTKEISNELLDRIKSETPTHFKRIRTAGFIVCGLGLAIKLLAVFIVPPVGLISVATDMIWIGGAAAGISTTAKK